MLWVNLWQKFLRGVFEKETMKGTWKIQETVQLASISDADRKGGWGGDLICQVGGWGSCTALAFTEA